MCRLSPSAVNKNNYRLVMAARGTNTVTGQSDIKKLRKENDHLRKEIWALREECDRLQELLKQKEEELEDNEADDDGEEDGDDTDEDGDSQEGDRNKSSKYQVDELSIVPEETEDSASNNEHSPPPLPPPGLQSLERRIEEFRGILPPCLRINSVHPFTAATNIDKELLPNLVVSEIIEEAIRCEQQLVGVRLLDGCLYLSTSSKSKLEALLSKGITLRNVQLTLHDVSSGTIVLSLSGVPYHLSDNDLAHILSQFGPVIGVIERRLYRDVDTGERIVRIRPAGTLPKKLYIQGSEISLRPIPHQELARMSIQQVLPKPTLHIRIQNSTPDTSKESVAGPSEEIQTNEEQQKKEEPQQPQQPQEQSNVEISGSTRIQPPTPSSASSHSIPKLEERCQSAPAGTTSSGGLVGGGSLIGLSPGPVRRGLSDSEVKKGRRIVITKRGPSPSSSSDQDTPATIKSVRSRRISGLLIARRQTDEETVRERSVSLSSRGSFRRKLSITGRETGKLPWCACWGNGCL